MVSAHAVPACPDPKAITQPDGSTVTVILHGDEYYHFSTTTDGYTVMKNDKGFYTYAQLNAEGESGYMVCPS